jgi:hypothetical protein
MSAILQRPTKTINGHLNGKELHSNDIFDKVTALSEKPPAQAEGFIYQKTSDSFVANAKDGDLSNPILAQPPNLYKHSGAFVSKIPYFFETPVPKYFRENGWFDSEHTFKFVTWAFSRCSTQSHKKVINNKEITLQPYEFIAGRLTSPKECFLSENIFRNQLISMQKAGLLKKSTNSLTNKYTCYIWVTDRFLKNDNQQNNQQITNRQPTDNHNQEEEKRRSYRKDHPSIPSFEKKGIDDLFSKEEQKNKIHLYTGEYFNKAPCVIYLTQEEYDECLKARGSHERVIDIIQQVVSWPGRKYEIKDWVKTIKDWKFKNVIGDRVYENEKLAKKIEDIYGESEGWKARIYRDNVKDIRGILFEGQGAASLPIFFPFTEVNFKEKCLEIIKSKQMTRKGDKK